jgi:hypothetical protein
MEIFMSSDVKFGIYRHFKGGIYEVLSIAKHSETLEDMVVYRNVLNGDCWVRPSSMWDESVEYNGNIVSRFTFIASDKSEI